MANLKLANPKMMDVAVPANMHVGLHQDEIARKGWAVSAAEAIALRGRPDVAINIDLREKTEREKHGVIPGSLHAPYPSLPEEIGAGGMLHELAKATGGKWIVFDRAFGERSAMAVQAAQDAASTPQEGRRPARALTRGAAGAAPVSSVLTLSAAVRCEDTAGVEPWGYCFLALSSVTVARENDEDILAVFPVHWRRHLVLGGELERVDDPQYFVEVAAGGYCDNDNKLISYPVR